MSSTVGKTSLAYSRAWHLIDLSKDPRPLGRLATSIAITLMGKHKPTWDPSTDCGDYVVAVNCKDLFVTGRKLQQKKYYRHTTRPGSLKEWTMETMIRRWGAGEVLRRAVSGMLPKNKLRDKRLARLKTFEGAEHPHVQNVLSVNYVPKKAQEVGKVQSPILEEVARLKEAARQ